MFEIDYDNNVLLKYIEEDGETEVVIPDYITSIAPAAFLGCKRLSTITIPDSVMSIGASAFNAIV